MDIFDVIAAHADWVSDSQRHCSCGRFTDGTDTAQNSRRLWAVHVTSELGKHGFHIVGTGAISPRPKPPGVKDYVDVPLPLDFDDEVDAHRVADILNFMQPLNEIGKRP
jgi:hypothetical protein